MRQLLPALEATGITAETLSATSQRMARARSYLEQQTAEAAARCLTLHDAGYISLHWPHFSTLHPEIALRVLADILRLMNGSAYRPRLSELENLYAALPEARTLAGCRFIPQTGKANSDTMLILRELAHIAPPQQLMPHQPTLWDGRFEVTLLSDTPAEISGWGESAPEGELHLPKRAVPVLPVIRLEKAFSIPHIPYETGEDGRASTSGIRCEIRTFPLRGNLGYS